MRQNVFEPKDVSSRMSEVAPDALRGLIQFGRMPYLGRVVSVLLLWCCVIVVLINLRFFRRRTNRVVPYLSVSWKSSLWWTNIGGLFILGGLISLANYLYVCELSWMFLRLLFVMWQLIMWSSSTYVFFSTHFQQLCNN